MDSEVTEVELPDGTVLEVPAGADIKRAVTGYMAKRGKPAPAPEDPPFMARVGRGMLDVGQGVKQLALQAEDLLDRKLGKAAPPLAYDRASNTYKPADLGPRDPSAADYTARVNRELADYEAARAAHGHTGTDWGRLLGNAVATAPLGAGVGVPATLGVRVALGAGLGAAAGGVQYSPTGSHTGNMVAGAAVGGAVPVAGNVLRATLGGLRPATAEAAQLVQQGVPLTTGQLKGGAVQSIENGMSRLPFVGNAVRARQTEALQGWNRNLMNEVRPATEPIATAGQQGMQQLAKQFTDAYEALWNRPITLKTGETLPGKQLQELLQNFNRDARSAAMRGDRALADSLSARSAQITASLPDDVAAELARINGLFTQYSAVQRAGAATGAAQQGGTFTPQQLLSGSKAADRTRRKAAFATGTAPMQQQAQQAGQVFRPSNIPPSSLLERAALNTAGAIPGALARPLYSKPVQSLLRGTTQPQQWAQGLYDNSAKTQAVINLLRKQSTPISAAYTAQPEIEQWQE